MDLLPIFLQTVLPTVGTLLTGLVAWGAKKATTYVATKTKNEQIEAGMARLCGTVETTVADLNQRVLPAMIAKTADGKLSREDAQALKQMAVETVYQQVPQAALDAVGMAVNSVEALVRAKIEQAVGKAKAS